MRCFVTHLECSLTGKTYSCDEVHGLSEAGKPLLVRYDHPGIIGWINDDPGVIEATYAYLLLVPITYGFLGVGMVAGSTFIALGKPLPTLILSISRMIIIYIPLALLLEIWFGYRGIYAAAAVCNVIMGWAAVTWVKRTLGTQISRSHV